jgi:hypothetical protein
MGVGCRAARALGEVVINAPVDHCGLVLRRAGCGNSELTTERSCKAHWSDASRQRRRVEGAYGVDPQSERKLLINWAAERAWVSAVEGALTPTTRAINGSVQIPLQCRKLIGVTSNCALRSGCPLWGQYPRESRWPYQGAMALPRLLDHRRRRS